MIDQEDVGRLVVGCAMKVHSALGPGLLESAYETCMVHELSGQGLKVQKQVAMPVRYKGIAMNCGYRPDLLVERAVVVELKPVDGLNDVHLAQIPGCPRPGGFRPGYLLNFNVRHMKDGIRRVVD